MRYEYIKATSSEKMMHFADQAQALGTFELHQQMKTHEQQKTLYPIRTINNTPTPPPPNSALIQHAYRQSRFNYNDYMKGLNDKLSLTAPNTSNLVGSGF